MRRRKRIARTLDWLIAGWIDGPLIDPEALDALIDAVAALEAKGNARNPDERSTESSPVIK